jgi:hypothetical protein
MDVMSARDVSEVNVMTESRPVVMHISTLDILAYPFDNVNPLKSTQS